MRGPNSDQLACLQRWVGQSAEGKPALIGGDFNAHETAGHVQHARSTWLDTFRALHPYADGTTHELRWPWGGLMRRARLDYIFLHAGARTWQVQHAQTIAHGELPYSDHRAVLARLVPTPPGLDTEHDRSMRPL